MAKYVRYVLRGGNKLRREVVRRRRRFGGKSFSYRCSSTSKLRARKEANDYRGRGKSVRVVPGPGGKIYDIYIG